MIQNLLSKFKKLIVPEPIKVRIIFTDGMGYPIQDSIKHGVMVKFVFRKECNGKVYLMCRILLNDGTIEEELWETVREADDGALEWTY